MGFECKILADSVNPVGCRLVTFEVTYPRFIHSELLTHRMFSRNSASSRAIPWPKMREKIESDPVMPIKIGVEQKGMNSGEEIPEPLRDLADEIWRDARDAALRFADDYRNIGETYYEATGDDQYRDFKIHKSLPNRITEPWMWITVIVSTTSFEHFRRLRVHPDAEPHFQKLAGMMAEMYDSHKPQQLKAGEWHLPLIGFDGDEKLTLEGRIKVSAARCARVSYLTHDGERDVQADLDLHDKLAANGHWSPFEHPAMALPHAHRYGNFAGFKQYRKQFVDEFVSESVTGNL